MNHEAGAFATTSAARRALDRVQALGALIGKCVGDPVRAHVAPGLGLGAKPPSELRATAVGQV